MENENHFIGDPFDIPDFVKAVNEIYQISMSYVPLHFGSKTRSKQ